MITMKQCLLLSLLIFITSGLFASGLTEKKATIKAKPGALSEEPIDYSGFENDLSSAALRDVGASYTENNTSLMQAPIGTVVGTNTYDLQTNTGICRRVALSANNTFVYTAWTYSNTYTLASPDRGTGFNFYNRNTDVWQAAPTSAIEQTERTGWPNVGFTDLGRTFSVCHSIGNGLMFVWRDGNGSEWNEVAVGNIVGDPDGVWARSAIDGTDIHVVISRFSSFGGVENGVNYIRSLDNGDTWEGMGGLEADYTQSYGKMGADCYQIDAQDGNVAVIFGDNLTEVNLYTSDNSGTSWNKNTLVSMSNPNVSYDPELGFYVDPYWGTHGGNTVIYDSNNQVHVVFSGALQFNSSDNDWVSNSMLFRLLNSTALWYWNENMEEPEIIGKTVMNDNDADGVLGADFNLVENVLTYTGDMVGQPLLAIDDQDNLYVSYSAHVDGNWQPESMDVISYMGRSFEHNGFTCNR